MRRASSLLVLVGTLLACSSALGGSPHLGATATPVTTPTCVYRQNGALPDLSCTPGAVNRHVTQSNIHKTICVKGWTATIRPAANITGPEKLVSMRQYGFMFGSSPTGYEYDHLIPLELGGAPNATSNLWPEPHHPATGKGSYTKDGIENALRNAVCSGKITLALARREIRKDWTKVTIP